MNRFSPATSLPNMPGCESARKWDPLRNQGKKLFLQAILVLTRGPERRRSEPRQNAE
jgi:hypothetical protein